MHCYLVAIAYILHKTPHVFPVIGGPKVEQMFASIKGLEICLSSEHISYLKSAVIYDPAHLPNVNTRLSWFVSIR